MQMAETTSSPYLWVLKRIKYDGEFLLEGGKEYTLGRNLRSSFPIKSLLVSKEHCVLKEDQNKLTIVDLRSSNGTFVNEKSIPSGEKVQLKSGCTIGLGVRSVACEDDFVFKAVRVKKEPDCDSDDQEEGSAAPEVKPEVKCERNDAPAEDESFSVTRIIKEEEDEDESLSVTRIIKEEEKSIGDDGDEGGRENKKEVQQQSEQLNEGNIIQEKEKTCALNDRSVAESSGSSTSSLEARPASDVHEISVDSARTKELSGDDSSSGDWYSYWARLEGKIKKLKREEKRKDKKERFNQRRKRFLQEEQTPEDTGREASNSQKALKKQTARVAENEKQAASISLNTRHSDVPIEHMQPVVKLRRTTLEDIKAFSRDVDEILARGTNRVKKSRKRCASSSPESSVSSEPHLKVTNCGKTAGNAETDKSVSVANVTRNTGTLNEPEITKNISRHEFGEASSFDASAVQSDITKPPMKTSSRILAQDSFNSPVASSLDFCAVCSSASFVNAESNGASVPAPAHRKPVQRKKMSLMCDPLPMKPKHSRMNPTKCSNPSSLIPPPNGRVAKTSHGSNPQLDKERMKQQRKEKLKQLAERQKKIEVERTRLNVSRNVKVTGKSRTDKLLEAMLPGRSKASHHETDGAGEHEDEQQALFDFADPEDPEEPEHEVAVPMKLSFKDLERKKMSTSIPVNGTSRSGK